MMSGADEYVYYISWTLNQAGKHNTKSGGPFFSKQTAKSTHHSARESAWEMTRKTSVVNFWRSYEELVYQLQ